MDFIPYATQSINEDDLAAVREVLTSGWLTQGPAVPRFEQAFAQRHGVAHAVAVVAGPPDSDPHRLALDAGRRAAQAADHMATLATLLDTPTEGDPRP